MTAPIQRDSSDQAELPDLPFPSTSVEDLLRSFVKALRAHQLYLPNNPIYKAAIDTVRYIVDKYGCAPSMINPVRAKFSCQAHHVDLDYYRQFHVAPTGDPYLAPNQLLSHFKEWHPGAGDPYERRNG